MVPLVAKNVLQYICQDDFLGSEAKIVCLESRVVVVSIFVATIKRNELGSNVPTDNVATVISPHTSVVCRGACICSILCLHVVVAWKVHQELWLHSNWVKRTDLAGIASQD